MCLCKGGLEHWVLVDGVNTYNCDAVLNADSNDYNDQLLDCKLFPLQASSIELQSSNHLNLVKCHPPQSQPYSYVTAMYLLLT
jgi:hypothetical protein